MIPLRLQLLGHLMVGVVVSLLLHLTIGGGDSEWERKAQPFTTQNDMLAVSVVLHRDRAPEIVEVQPLPQGRPTVTQPGEYRLMVENSQGHSLYEMPFKVSFTMPGIHSASFDEMRFQLVIPSGPDAARLVVEGPQGNGTYDLSNRDEME